MQAIVVEIIIWIGSFVIIHIIGIVMPIEIDLIDTIRINKPNIK